MSEQTENLVLELLKSSRGSSCGMNEQAPATRQIGTVPVTCDTCAAACCRMEVPCIGDHDIPGRLTETDAAGNARMRRLDDGWCAALDRIEMNCGIYARRPLPCRELAVGGPDCLAARQRLAEDAGQMV